MNFSRFGLGGRASGLVKRALMICAVLVCCSAGARPAAAQGLIPTFDTGMIANAARIAGLSAEQVNQLIDVVNVGRQMQSTLGASGGNHLSLGSLPLYSMFQSGGGLLQGLSNFGPNKCFGTSCATSGGSNWVPPDYTSLSSTRTAVTQTFYAPRDLRPEEKGPYVTARQQALRTAATDGLSLATKSRQQMAQFAQGEKSLQDMVDASTDMRGDVQANTAVVLALAQQLGMVQTEVTSLLEQQSLVNIGQDPSFNSNGGITAQN